MNRIVLRAAIIFAAVALALLILVPGRFGMTPAAPDWLPEDVRRW